MSEAFVLHDWLRPIVILATGVLVGLVLENLVLAWLRRFAERTAWKGDDVIVESLTGATLVGCSLLGAYFATFHLPLSAPALGHVRNGLLVVLVLAATVVLSRMVSGLIATWSGGLPSTSIFRNISKLVIYVLGALVILQTLGISIAPILTALGVGGLAVALALQDTLSNLFAGIHILASRQVRVGDYVQLDTGQEGYVQDIAWRNSAIKTLPNNLIIVPNSKLASAIVTNYHSPTQELAVLVNLGVSYDSDLEKVERVTVEVGREIMKKVEGGVPAFDPFIRYNKFGESGIGFTVILRGKQFTDQYLITHEFVKALHARYKKEGIVVPFPMRTLTFQGALPGGAGSPVPKIGF